MKLSNMNGDFYDNFCTICGTFAEEQLEVGDWSGTEKRTNSLC